jgi:transcriptional regulator with XRE-family HTH domain
MPYDYDKAVGDRIKQFREKLGWTQEQLSAKNADRAAATLPAARSLKSKLGSATSIFMK